MDQIDPFKPLLPRKEPPWPPNYDCAQFAALPVDHPRPLVKGLLDCGSRVLFGGGSKTFKTWMQCDLAICLAEGIEWLGFECHKTNVMYVNLELKEYYMRQRLDEIRLARKIPKPQTNLRVWNLRGVQFSRDQFSEKLLSLCQQHESQVVFVDPYYRMLSVEDDENSQTAMAHVLRCFDPLNKAEITTAFGIHFSKGNQAQKEPEDRISGAGSLVRDADGVITLTKHQEPLAFTLDFLIRDHPPIDSFVVKWLAPVMDRTDLDPAKIKTPLGRSTLYSLQPIVDLIRDHDDQLSTQELETLAIHELHMGRSTFYAKLSQIKKQKLARLSVLTNNWNI